VRQSLEWHLISADVDKARAEYRELKAREKSAVQGIRLDVRRVFLDFHRAEKDLEGAGKGRKLARQWLQEARDEYEFDPGTIKDLIAAFETWAHLEQGYSEAIYDFNLSIASLELATGGLELSR
jgi:outer membrane protein TolC